MRELLALSAIVVGVVLIAYIVRRRLINQAALDMLGGIADDDDLDNSRPALRPRPFARRHYIIPWLVAAIVASLLFFLAQLSIIFAAAGGFLVGLILSQLDDLWLSHQQAKIENQLADAIDLMTGAVGAGAGLQRALEVATEEAPRPLAPILQEAVGRIRYGDDPLDVMTAVRDRVPLETFRLFTTAMAVNWQSGGSLSETLANVERTIRDRIELNRRVAAMSMQVRFSIAGVLAVTYFIAALVWRNNPDRMVGFLGSTIGQWMTAAAMVLQGVGIVWISRMSKLKF